jgi:hypothetical protein
MREWFLGRHGSAAFDDVRADCSCCASSLCVGDALAGRLVCSSDRDGTPENNVVDLDGGEPLRLMDNDTIDMNPDWSPRPLHVGVHLEPRRRLRHLSDGRRRI